MQVCSSFVVYVLIPLLQRQTLRELRWLVSEGREASPYKVDPSDITRLSKYFLMHVGEFPKPIRGIIFRTCCRTMDELVRDSLIEDLKSSLIGTSEDYKIYIGWNPENNTDYGWLNLRKGVYKDISYFQLRDFNYNQQMQDATLYGDTKEAAEITEKSEDDPKSGLGDFCNVETGSVEIKVTDKKFDMLGNSRSLVKCSFCNKSVKNLQLHLMKCNHKKSTNYDRVKCPKCNYKVSRKCLSSHLWRHNQSIKKIVCPHCYREIIDKNYDLHLVKCPAKNRNGPSFECLVCAKTYSKGGLHSHFKRVHPTYSQKRFETTIGESEEFSSKEVAAIKWTEIVKPKKMTGEKKVRVEVRAAVDESDMLPCVKLDKVLCRLKFKLLVNGVVSKKIIKSLSHKPVGIAMKKFAIHFGKNVKDLDFYSNDCVLDGEELAGSIEKGCITARLLETDDQVMGEVESDILNAAADLGEKPGCSISSERLCCSKLVPNRQVEGMDLELASLSPVGSSTPDVSVPDIAAYDMSEDEYGGSKETLHSRIDNNEGQDLSFLLENSVKSFEIDKSHVLDFSNF